MGNALYASTLARSGAYVRNPYGLYAGGYGAYGGLYGGYNGLYGGGLYGNPYYGAGGYVNPISGLVA